MLPDADSVDTFSIEASNGRVKLAKSLDSVQRNHYRLLVKAEDDSDPPKFDTAEVIFFVCQTHDNTNDTNTTCRMFNLQRI